MARRAACAGALTWMAIEWWSRGKPSVLGMVSGAVAGLGTITPASGFVLPWHGIVIGMAAGAICFYACTSVKRIYKYDDLLDVFGVHGVGGMTGTVLCGRVRNCRTIGFPRDAPWQSRPSGRQPLTSADTDLWNCGHHVVVRGNHRDFAEDSRRANAVAGLPGGGT